MKKSHCERVSDLINAPYLDPLLLAFTVRTLLVSRNHGAREGRESRLHRSVLATFKLPDSRITISKATLPTVSAKNKS